MPYIKPEFREEIDTNKKKPENAGELNYIITKSCLRYLIDRGVSYATLNDVIGVLSNVQYEISRRIIQNYEDLKITENGDLEEFDEIVKMGN